jgi:FtsX-like permease family
VPDILAVAIGVPVAAALVARLALRRVTISPLGVTRRVTPAPPRAWRVLPLPAGLAELGFFAVHGRPASVAGQVQAFLPGFALIMTGLVTAGPWLTMAGARVIAGRASRPGPLIAARRLADDPRAGFRAVSGLVLALFITTVAVALITTQNTKRTAPLDGAAAGNVLVDQFAHATGAGPGPGSSALSSAPAPAAEVLARLSRIPGVQGIAELRADPGLTTSSPQLGIPLGFPAALVACAQLASTPALGRCPAGAATAEVSPFLTTGHFAGLSPAAVTWPAAGIPASRLGRLTLYSLYVATDGSPSAIEQARTVLENAYPTGTGSSHTLTEDTATRNAADTAYQQLADVVILTSPAIAGCTLAAAIAAGLADRRKPFSLLRLTGAPLGLLRRIVVMESAVPLLAVAAVAIGTGFAAAAMFTAVQLGHPLVAPGAAYYVVTAGGVGLALAVIAATFPLLRRITGPEAARND